MAVNPTPVRASHPALGGGSGSSKNGDNQRKKKNITGNAGVGGREAERLTV